MVNDRYVLLFFPPKMVKYFKVVKAYIIYSSALNMFSLNLKLLVKKLIVDIILYV